MPMIECMPTPKDGVWVDLGEYRRVLALACGVAGRSMACLYVRNARMLCITAQLFPVPPPNPHPPHRCALHFDAGGGTAANLEHLKDHIGTFKQVIVLDLCRPLLDVAAKRVEANGWTNVKLVGDRTPKPYALPLVAGSGVEGYLVNTSPG